MADTAPTPAEIRATQIEQYARGVHGDRPRPRGEAARLQIRRELEAAGIWPTDAEIREAWRAVGGR